MVVLKEPVDMSGSDMEDDRFAVEPDFNDPEGFYDDVTDDQLMPDLLRQRPKESDGMDSVIIVDGIPTASKDKLDKLKNVIRKIFKKVSPSFLFFREK